MAADGPGWPWKLLRLDVCGNWLGNCRGLPRTSVVIAAMLWQWPRMAVEIATAAVAIAADFSWLPRTEPRHVPCGHNHCIFRGSAMSRGTCREHPRISTVACGNTHGNPRKFRGHCRGPQPKSKKMCIPGTMPFPPGLLPPISRVCHGQRGYLDLRMDRMRTVLERLAVVPRCMDV